MTGMDRRTFGVTTLAALAARPAPSSAQNWPQRPVRFIVTLGPASGIDIGTRLLSDHLSASGPAGRGREQAGR